MIIELLPILNPVNRSKLTMDYYLDGTNLDKLIIYSNRLID